MTKLSKLIEDIIKNTISTSEERDAFFQALKLEEKFGGSKSIDILDQYEKIIEGLI